MARARCGTSWDRESQTKEQAGLRHTGEICELRRDGVCARQDEVNRMRRIVRQRNYSDKGSRGMSKYRARHEDEKLSVRRGPKKSCDADEEKFDI